LPRAICDDADFASSQLGGESMNGSRRKLVLAGSLLALSSTALASPAPWRSAMGGERLQASDCPKRRRRWGGSDVLWIVAGIGLIAGCVFWPKKN
jgi:hypothetical protein